MFHCLENTLRLLEILLDLQLSLSYLSQQITTSHCLHSLRDNDVGTVDLISFPHVPHS